MPYAPMLEFCSICDNSFYTRKPKSHLCSPVCKGKFVAEKRRQAGRVKQRCSFDGCDRPMHGYGLCHRHYMRVRNYGRTTLMQDRRPDGMSVHDWFMSKVEKTDTCWIWQGQIIHKRGGYGVFYDADKGKKIRAHHFFVPPLPTGKPKMEYDHLCNNPACVNPDHLELVTATENRKREARRIREGKAVVA